MESGVPPHAGRHRSLTGRLVDELSGALYDGSTAVGRSEVVCRLVDEIVETVEWIGPADDPADSELASLMELKIAALAHASRMALRDERGNS